MKALAFQPSRFARAGASSPLMTRFPKSVTALAA